MSAIRRRLLVVASTFPAREGDGTPAFVKDLSVKLGKDFDTVVVVPRVPGAPPSESIEGVRIERFAYFPRPWERLADGAIIENLRARPSAWLQVPPFVGAEAVRLRRLLREFKPDVLHLHWIIPQGIAALAVARRVPWVVTTLGGDVYALRDPVSARIRRAVLARAAAVTTMNADMRDRLVAAGSAPDRTFVQVLGADIDSIRRYGAGIEPIPGRLLFVGRLVEKKGLSVLLDALAALPDMDWSLEVIGDGPLLDALTAKAAGLPVTFSGPASRPELARAYARSSAVVVPSVPAASGDQDGLPTVLLEAMSLGRPVVGSALPGIDEALTHGETGLLVPPNDPQALAVAVKTLLNDHDLRARLGEAAAERSEAFSTAACAARFTDILSAAAERAPA